MEKSIPWSYSPYRPYFFETGDIYICRISPEKDSFYLEWLEASAEVTVFLRKRDEGEFQSIGTTKNNYFTVTDLTENTDYEVFVSSGKDKSRVRIVRTGAHVGVAVNYLHPDDRAYSFSGNFLCSPSLVRHPDGFLLASMDLFKGDSPQNLTLIFRSDDEGVSWHYVSELMPCFWGKLFILKGELYMIACSTEYGDLLIGKSTDGGKTFTAPSVILRGSNGKNGKAGVHKNPQNVLIYSNRLYITIEWGAWGSKYHAPTVISADIESDLLDYSSWAIPHPVKYDPSWEGTAKGDSPGNIEGTLAVSPDNKLYNIMRYQTGGCVPEYGLALVYEVDTVNHENPIKYAYAMEFDANLSKFMIKKDEKTGLYFSIASRITDPTHIYARNLLSLMASRDLKKWETVCDVIDRRDDDPNKVGFQYVDFEIEGDDIIFLCRTAENQAENYHNSNYITFHRIKSFRNLLKY